MTTRTGLEPLDRGVHQANTWLADLAESLGEDRKTAYRALAAYLQLLRDQLTVEEGAHLAAQLPQLWRGVFYEGWTPSRRPDHLRDHTAFLRRLAEDALLAGPTEASLAVEACTKVLRTHIDEHELRHVVAVLPDALAPLLT